MPLPPNLIESVLLLPGHAIAYHAGARLRELLPDKTVLEFAGCGFDLDGYVDAGHARLTLHADFGYSQSVFNWRGCTQDPMGTASATGETGLARKIANAFVRLDWQDRPG